MAGLMTVHQDPDLKMKEAQLIAELKARAVAQKIVTTPDQVVVRDLLPYTDFGETTGGYMYELWEADMITYQRNGSTASAANAYNDAILKDLDEKKVVGILGVAKHGEDNVATVRFTLGAGQTKIKDIWQLDKIEVGETGLAEMPIIYNKTDTMGVQYYLKNRSVVQLELLGKVAEAVGDIIMGGQS